MIASLPILLTNIQPGTLLVKYIQVHVWEGKGGDNKAGQEGKEHKEGGAGPETIVAQEGTLCPC